jgi:hypothetical protein
LPRATPWAKAVLSAEMTGGAPLTMLVLLLPLLVEKLHGVEAMLAVVVGRWCTSCATSMKDELRAPRSRRLREREKIRRTTTADDIMNMSQTFMWYL